MYLKQIEQLIVLQEVDDEVILLEQELEKLPEEVAQRERKSERLAQRAQQLTEKSELLKKQQQRLKAEIEENATLFKKSKDKLMLAGNTREYHAMTREMDNLEKVNRTREEEYTTLVEELERQNTAQEELKEETQNLHTDLEERRNNLEKALAATQKRLDTLLEKRNTACQVVPAPVLTRYEFIRSRIENPVIVRVEEGVCSGCYILIPPQIYNDLQKGEQIISCPNCQRLIYWNGLFDQQTTAPEKSSTAKKEKKAVKKPANKKTAAQKKTPAKKTTAQKTKQDKEDAT